MNMSTHKNQEGFSYIDVLIAITILMIGLLALVAAVTASVVQTRAGEQNLLAKQYAASTLEAIFSSRDIGDLGWDSVGNVGTNPVNGVPQGKFVVGRQSIYPDDGPDNIAGTADDTGTPVKGFDRQIVITDICDPDRPSANCSPSGSYGVMIRKVEVTIYYQVTGGWRSEKTTTIISNSLVDQ
jgi:type II secretory pathway pseudopilin PulG